jgi:bifunctional non-homologous end joining protein LigD
MVNALLNHLIRHRKQIGRYREPEGASGFEIDDDFTWSADLVFRHACKLGFEGIVSKRVGSPYRSGRSRDWLN